MANYETLLFEKEGAVAQVTVNRPDKLNSLNSTVVRELAELFRAIAVDPDIKAVVVTGAGDRAFVAGADISEVVAFGPAEGFSFIENGQVALNLVDNCPKVVIAAVNGFALGGGLELALACDFVYASAKAKFGLPEINLAILPAFGGTQRLARLIGKNMAKEMIFTGEHIGAEEALRVGIVNKVFPPDQLLAEAKKTAAKIAAKGGVALQYAKLCVNQGYNTDLDRGLIYERQAFAVLCGTEDKKEGMTAFLEKRPAVVKNK